ncbi:MAG: hypothetical protein WA532_09840 [Candidatus Korobacteraceae bacterium]
MAYLYLMAKTKAPQKRSARIKRTSKKVVGECLIPPRVPNEALNQFAFKRNDEEAQRIADYVEWQSRKDKEHVTFLEKIQTEYVFGQAHDCWNVHTNKSQWWVITGPTNLYSQALFPSLDYTLSFHIGLMARVTSEHKGTEDVRLADRVAAAFRRWEQAAESLDQSTESEDVQAVGMRCREALLAFVRSVSNPSMVPTGEDVPQASNFVRWSELIAETVAQGSRNERIRGYLKALAKESWQLVSWLTHAANATRDDGTIALDATHAVMEAFGTALIRHERQAPERCGRCGSLKLTTLYRPELQFDGAVCQSCGWEKLPPGEPDDSPETLLR